MTAKTILVWYDLTEKNPPFDTLLALEVDSLDNPLVIGYHRKYWPYWSFYGFTELSALKREVIRWAVIILPVVPPVNQA